MKIVLAPDSFKGSMTAAEACEAMRTGVLAAAPEAEVLEVPMADGGEGTTDALAAATGGEIRQIEATGPLPADRPRVPGRVGLLGDGSTAVLEMACVSGLPLVPADKRNPLHTTTYGTGELIAAALDAGAVRVIVGIGGSATTDMGAGMAQALGVRFFDESGSEITEPMTGQLLGQVTRIDMTLLDPRVRKATIEVACDVDNPLLGEHGSAKVYGPQKGATPAIVDQLEGNLTRAIGVVEAELGREVRNTPGAGAAGGLGAGLLAFLGAQLKPGTQIVVDAARLVEKVAGADLVLTGEGQVDRQTAYGKTISGVARAAKDAGAACIALVGGIDEPIDNLYDIGVTSALSICPGPVSLDDAMANGAQMMAKAAERVMRVWVRRQES